MPAIELPYLSDKWDRRFIELAKHIALWSKDPKAKVGCVLASPDNKQVVFGYNGLANGLDDDTYIKHHDKLSLMLHAELNALMKVKDASGWKAYVTKPVCAQCASVLINSGITKVFMPELDSTSKWYKSQYLARDILTQSQVIWTIYKD